jgi:hypothetical protein
MEEKKKMMMNMLNKRRGRTTRMRIRTRKGKNSV